MFNFRKILLALAVLVGGLGVSAAIGSSPAAAYWNGACYSGTEVSVDHYGWRDIVICNGKSVYMGQSYSDYVFTDDGFGRSTPPLRFRINRNHYSASPTIYYSHALYCQTNAYQLTRYSKQQVACTRIPGR